MYRNRGTCIIRLRKRNTFRRNIRYCASIQIINLAMAYVIGNISGCHINPAVFLSMLINKKLTVKDFIRYVVVTGLEANGFGELSAINLNMLGTIITEVVLTFVFIYTILGVTSDEIKSPIAGVVIGLTLAFVHIMGIQLTGTSVNPARSLAPALFLGEEALKQV